MNNGTLSDRVFGAVDVINNHWFIKPRVFGYSLMGILNLLLVQWFFMRIWAIITVDYKVQIKLIGFMVPMTGWWSNYVWIRKVL